MSNYSGVCSKSILLSGIIKVVSIRTMVVEGKKRSNSIRRPSVVLERTTTGSRSVYINLSTLLWPNLRVIFGQAII